MPEMSAPIEIPNRALFKAAEVCELVKVQPYVLRSWEAEFPDLGVAKVAGGTRVYRREDVERVMLIRHLLLVEGLTLAGARRRLVDDSMAVPGNAAVIEDLIGENARQRLTEVKQGLRSLLDLLAGRTESREFELAPPAEPRAAPAAKARSGRQASTEASPRAKGSA